MLNEDLVDLIEKAKASKLDQWESEVTDRLKVPLVQSFFRTLRCYVRDFKPDQIISVWDKRLVREFKNFRKEAVDVEYKATRDYTELKLMHSFDGLIMDMLKSLGVKVLFPRVMEGDDVIAWLSHTLPGEKVIVSVDHDFFQLVTEQTSVFSPIKKELITHQNLAEHTKVDPSVFVLYKAIKGDVSDNVPGLTGFGTVKSKKLAENWEQLSTKLTDEQKEIVNRNVRIVDLKIGYTVHDGEVESYQEQLDSQQEAKLSISEFKKLCRDNHLHEFTTQVSTFIEPFQREDALSAGIMSLIGRLNLPV